MRRTASRLAAPTPADLDRVRRRAVTEWTDDGVALHDPPRTTEETFDLRDGETGHHPASPSQLAALALGARRRWSNR